VLVVPPIVRLAGNAKQVVRLAPRYFHNEPYEQSYRLFIHEIPKPVDRNFKGLTLALQLSVPVFIAPNTSSVSKVVWKIKKRYADGRLAIAATNEGNVHVLVSKVALTQVTTHQSMLNKKVFAYILPGKTKEWIFDPKAKIKDKTIHLQASTDQGTIETDIA